MIAVVLTCIATDLYLGQYLREYHDLLSEEYAKSSSISFSKCQVSATMDDGNVLTSSIITVIVFVV